MEKLDKVSIFDWFYEQGDVYITTMTKGSDLLKVPPECTKKDMETFVIGESPTPGFEYNDNGLTAPMRFGKKVINCFFPWDCIVMMSGKKAVMQFIMEDKPGNDTYIKDLDKKNSNQKKKTTRKKGHLQIVK